jgi:hypothetical protein
MKPLPMEWQVHENKLHEAAGCPMTGGSVECRVIVNGEERHARYRTAVTCCA